jgi:LDH2 family malate/lactate/ureidoglycolate dehydrogenase
VTTTDQPTGVLVAREHLQRYGSSILANAGLPTEDADLVATSLVDANLRGVDSHGVSRIPIYVERLHRGLVNPRPDVRVTSETGASLQIDGDNGMGQVVLDRALTLGLDRLPEHRSLSVGVRNSNHYGSGAFFAKRAIAANAAIFLYGNASSTMSAWGGRDRYLGTNPYTFGIPAGRCEPMILDMATSVVARGKIILAAQLGNSIPEGWAVDTDGRPTTNAQAALDGSVLPFGGPKGYGIALMIEIMSGILAGANSGSDVGDLYDHLDRPQGTGAFFNLIDVAAFQPLDHFAMRMDKLLTEIRQSGAPGSDVLIPGQPETRKSQYNEEHGIFVPSAVVAKLESISPAGPLRS